MIKPGDIGFVMHHDNPISRVIAWVMGSKWSHSFMVADISLKRTYLVETSDYEVTYGSLEKYTQDKNCTLEIWSPANATDETRQKAVTYCEAHIEELYGYPQLISLGIRRLLMKCGIKIRNFIRWHLVCDEEVLEGAKCYEGLSDVDPKSIDTEELYELIVSSGKFIKVL